MAILTKKIKSEIFKAILFNPNFLGNYEEYDGILTFLNKIWDLKNMPSNDDRFKNAYEDANQHIVNNSDWTYEYLFLERLQLIDGDESYFILFLETVVNPTVRESREEILLYVSEINIILKPTKYQLILTDYFEELPVFRFRNSDELSDLPIDIIENKIPIYLAGVNKPAEPQYPYFVLGNDDWNDNFTYKTMFDLSFIKEDGSGVNLGKVKIMKRGEEITRETLSENFLALSSEYCSLGQEKGYYSMLKYYLGKDYYSFLFALRDVAIFPKIYEQFEQDDIFKNSIIRYDEVERLARTIRFELESINRNEYFKFNYTYQPPYAKNEITLNFDFEYNTDFEHRIYALIGKNGTGKTRILSSLAKNLSQKEPKNFSPRKPVYGKVFTVSYSFFDKFDIPNSDASFNYVYCGLKKTDNSWKTEDDMLIQFFKSVALIKKKGLVDDWYTILNNFIVKDILNIAFEKTEGFPLPYYEFNEEKFKVLNKMLSSGQNIILFLISEILSQIRFDSLILFDEPETHLHPNAISALINTLYNLVRRFQSFCIVATHSPLIIQELPARNIFIIDRDEDIAFVRGLEKESFGENLTVITQDIFGHREVPRHFITLIQELISKGKTYSEIITILESDQLPVTSNIRLYIKTLSPQ